MKTLHRILSTGLLWMALAVTAVGQTVSRVEYYWDTDPGFGRGTAVTGFSAVNEVVVNTGISTAGLSAGIHTLSIRARSSNGVWSGTGLHRVAVAGTLQNLSAVEYFYDADPGYGNGIAYTAFEAGPAVVINNAQLSLTELSDGFHWLGIRAKSDKGVWGPTYWYQIMKDAGGFSDVVSAEYFWDDADPGLGNATPYNAFSPSTSVSAALTVGTGELAPGIHRLSLRAKGRTGLWSPTYIHYVFVPGMPHADYAEYYWDTDPGYGQATALPVVPDNISLVDVSDIPVPTSDGLHTLCVRARAGATWSPTYVKKYCNGPTPMFSLLDGDTVCQNQQIIVLDESEGTTSATHYWWDLQGDGEDDLTTQGDFLHTYTQAGTYTLTLGMSNDTSCRNTYSRTVVVRSTQSPKVTISRDKNSVCAGTAVCFTAATQRAADYGQRLQWYRNDTLLTGLTADTIWLDDLRQNDRIRAMVRVNNPCAPADSAWSNQLTMTIYSLPEVTLTPVAYVYTDEQAFTLDSRFHATPAGGTYTVNGTQAVLFNPRRNGEGTYEVAYSYTNDRGCSNTAVTAFVLTAPTPYTVTAQVDDASHGTASGGGTYIIGTTATLTATAFPGYHFTQWSDGSTDNPRQETVLSDATYTALFEVSQGFFRDTTATACDRFVWSRNGETYTQSGEYQCTYYNAENGLDTLVLHLTVNSSQRSHEYLTHCGTYTWALTGKSYSKSGDKFHSGTTAEGCPIRDTLTLTIVSEQGNHEYVTHCGPYRWAVTGRTYQQSGNKYFDGTTDDGCLHHDTLTLTVASGRASHEYVTHCGAYTWAVNGTTYTESVETHVEGITAEGCETFDTLTLTIVGEESSHEHVTHCGPYTWAANGRTYNQSGVKYFKGTTPDGCFHRDTLTLTVVDKWTGHEYVTSCGPYTWAVNGKTYNQAGDKYYKGTAADGCPVRDTLTLTLVTEWVSHEYVTHCGPYTWAANGKTYNKSGDKYYKGTAADGCPVRDTLTLTVVDKYSSHETVTHCGPYTWTANGTTYSKSGVMYHNGTASDGCPVRDTLALTVVDKYASHEYVTHCGPYTWAVNGTTYNKSGTKYYKATAPDGCPVRDTLTLIVASGRTTHEYVTHCGPYIWNVTGQTYNKSGTKYYKGSTAEGCPVRDTLTLTVVSEWSSHEYVTNCGPYTWAVNGTTYNKSGTKYFKGTTPDGCLHRDTLTLTVAQGRSSHEYVTNCGPYTWAVNGTTYNKSGTKYYKGTTAEGCPIRDTLTLTVAQGRSSHEYVTNCGPYTWAVNGTTYNKSGTKYYKGTTPEGCPARDTLTLVVNPITTGDTFVTATGRFVWYGTIYTTSIEAMRLMTNQYGCDSLVTLHLTITGKGGGNQDANPSPLTSNLSLYPNPTTGRVQIDAATVEKVEVLDLVGRRVAVFDNTATLDLTDLAAGTYTLRVTLPEGVAIRKVVKK